MTDPRYSLLDMLVCIALAAGAGFVLGVALFIGHGFTRWDRLVCRFRGHKWTGACNPATHSDPASWDAWCDRCGTPKED